MGFNQSCFTKQPLSISETIIYLSHLMLNPCSCHSSFAIMDFTQLINNYKENDSKTSSPIWIQFKRKKENDAVCKTNIQRPDDTTPEKTLHLLISKLIESLLLHFNFKIFLSVYGLQGSETIHIVLLYLTINSLFSSFTKKYSANKELEDLSALKQTRLNK